VIHPTAIVHPNAEVGRRAEIGPFCVLGEHVCVGARTVLQAHVVVNGWTTIGEDCHVYPFATIGAASQDRKYRGERAYTRIGNRTVLREYVSIQRATGPEEMTAVGDDCLLLAYVHVAHNCMLGDGVTMSNLAQLAGHVEVGSYATIGGQAGVHQFTRIGRYAMVGGASKLTKDVPPFFLIEGNPARPYGLNSVGLRRAAFSAQERNEIKKFYKILYNPKLNVSQAIETMKAEVETAPGREILEFLEAPSERGVLK
jgi:UDP-N-acetylglucosamine acyltransferase